MGVKQPDLDNRHDLITIGGRDHAFPRSARLLNGVAFKRVFQKGKRIHTQSLMLVAAASEVGKPRLGLAISRRRVARAHERNRIKRFAREHFRLRRATLPNCDLVLLAKPGAAEQSDQRLHQEFEQLLNKCEQKCVGS